MPFRGGPSLVGDSMLIQYLVSERAAEDYCNDLVDGQGRLYEVDSTLSVSAFKTHCPELTNELKNLNRNG